MLDENDISTAKSEEVCCIIVYHPWGPRGSQSGREKWCDESFQTLAEEPLGTDSHWTKW